MQPTLTIGALATEAGVNVETLRYYERRGLLKQPSRPNGGWRLYSPESVARVRAIKRAQSLGFSLSQIGELMALSERKSPRTGEALSGSAARKIHEIDEKIAALKSMRASLVTLIEQRCDSLTGCSCGRGCVLEPPASSAPQGEHAMDDKRLANTLELLACDIAARPAAPGVEELAPFVTATHRTAEMITFAFRSEAIAAFTQFADAETVCCASLSWAIVDGAEPALRITAAAEQLDAIEALFGAARA